MPSSRSNILTCGETGSLPLTNLGELDRTGVPAFIVGLDAECHASVQQLDADALQVIRDLFWTCQNPQIGITEKDWEQAAKSLEIETELIRAVSEVEAPGGPFDRDGRPTILYERHYFHQSTNGIYSSRHPGISAAKAGGYGKLSRQYTRLQEAFSLDATHALESASWGRFQIMGRNFKDAGFASVEEMVISLTRSERAQLMAFVEILRNDRRKITALKAKDWSRFARLYNGPAYKKNNYDEKLRKAYQKLTTPRSAAHVNAPKSPRKHRIP